MVTPPTLQGLRVLVVDDDHDSCELMSLVLESHAAEVKTAFSVRHALEVMKQFKPDVLVSDIAMPGEDGYSLIGKVRTLRRKSIPAVAVTAVMEEGGSRDALIAGFDRCLAKPLDLDDFVAVISNLVEYHSNSN
ncbi:MAG: response regulator [Elainella sp. C42_A2020_010]|nr:response regulator [Elainella sp. C42_A2020_010]RNJ68732.1 MAG: response regulator [Leptolyngbya sp. IPPAS B-1204]